MQRRALSVLVACGLLASPAQANGQVSSESLDARAIYDRARFVVAARTLPPFIAYTQDAALVRHGKTRNERERIILRLADDKANITPLPDGPRDRVDTRPMVKDRPLVNPTTTFGLVERRSGQPASADESDSPPVPQPAESGPSVIGRVASTARDYNSA